MEWSRTRGTGDTPFLVRLTSLNVYNVLLMNTN